MNKIREPRDEYYYELNSDQIALVQEEYDSHQLPVQL